MECKNCGCTTLAGSWNTGNKYKPVVDEDCKAVDPCGRTMLNSFKLIQNSQINDELCRKNDALTLVNDNMRSPKFVNKYKRLSSFINVYKLSAYKRKNQEPPRTGRFVCQIDKNVFRDSRGIGSLIEDLRVNIDLRFGNLETIEYTYKDKFFEKPGTMPNINRQDIEILRVSQKKATGAGFHNFQTDEAILMRIAALKCPLFLLQEQNFMLLPFMKSSHSLTSVYRKMTRLDR
uniref:Uncharacterized protein n=1 Tax=Romanomermis culicivorax TaxID=13658 RepID=A0A915KU32_ROMCU